MVLGKACRDWLTASRSAASWARVTPSRTVLRDEPADTAGVSAARRDSAAPAPWHDNPRFHDMIVGACHAGFEPLPGPPSTTRKTSSPRSAPDRAPGLCSTPPRRPDARMRVAFQHLPGRHRQHNLPCGAPAVCASPAAPAQRLRIGQPNPNPAQAWPWPMPPSRHNTCPRHLQPDDVAFYNREPAGRPGPGAPRSSIRACNGRSGQPCGTRAITAMRASPSPAPITQCERNLNTSASAAGYGAVRHPHTEVKVAGLFGRRPQLAAGASGRFIRTRTIERPSRSASTTKRPHVWQGSA
jgi:hypothetical protein